MSHVKIYTTRFCPYCIRAKYILDSKGSQYEEIPVDGDQALRRKMTKLAGGQTSVPQIWIGEQHVGGCTDLMALERNGELDQIVERISFFSTSFIEFFVKALIVLGLIH